MVIDGEVTIVRGLHGSTRHYGGADPRSPDRRRRFFEEEAHATGAFTRNGATVWQISQAALAAFREENRINFTALSPGWPPVSATGCAWLLNGSLARSPLN
jgi:hypothetical protein